MENNPHVVGIPAVTIMSTKLICPLTLYYYKKITGIYPLDRPVLNIPLAINLSRRSQGSIRDFLLDFCFISILMEFDTYSDTMGIGVSASTQR